MSMNVVRVLVVMLLHNINAQQYPPQDPSAIANALQKPSGALAIKSFVMNCFPANELAAFVNFETDRVNRLRYGDLSIMVAALKPNSDFVIQFREALTDVVVQDLNDYGFMEPVLHPGMQILMVIGRDASPNVNKPKHHLAVFTAKDVEVESSKVYVFNAILNKADPRKGINVYGFYLRKNSDGSESESVTLLIDNLPMNSGKEISLEPGKKFFMKVTYDKIGSLLKLKQSEVVAETQFIATAGKRHYLILYGDHATLSDSGIQTKSSNAAKPAIKIVNEDDTSNAAEVATSSSNGHSLNCITICIISIALHILVYLHMYQY